MLSLTHTYLNVSVVCLRRSINIVQWLLKDVIKQLIFPWSNPSLIQNQIKLNESIWIYSIYNCVCMCVKFYPLKDTSHLNSPEFFHQIYEKSMTNWHTFWKQPNISLKGFYFSKMTSTFLILCPCTNRNQQNNFHLKAQTRSENFPPCIRGLQDNSGLAEECL